MDCRSIAFSAEKSHQRIEKFLRVFKPELLNRILAFALYLLGVQRQVVASMTGIPEESVKTALRTIQNDGFPALRDRRYSKEKSGSVSGSPSLEPKVTLHIDDQYCVVNFGAAQNEIRIRRDHKVHLKTLLLSLYQANLLTANDVASALGMTLAHCRHLTQKLTQNDVVETLVDKRQGQKQDYLVTAEEKAEIIKHFAALAVTGHSTSSEALAKAIGEANEIFLSPRTVRWHMTKLGLNKIKKALPELVDSLKKTAEHPR